MADVCDVPVISSVCDSAGDEAGSLVAAPFDWLAQGMGHAAGWMFEAVWTAFDSTTMVNVTSGQYTWHQHWPAICYSGSANTASGITFVGHFGPGDGSKGDGYLEAVDSKTVNSLWKSPTLPAPVAAAPIVYTVNGKEYVTVEVGGAGHNDVTRPAGLLSPVRVRNDLVYTWALP